MAAELVTEALGELCRRGGWSYAVVWRADRGNPRMLVIEDSYSEEQVRGVVDKMLNQAHYIGEGIIGGAVVNGKCQWMYADTCGMELLQASIMNSLDMLQGNTWWQLQLLDGIKTVAIISLPSFAVAQFGSMQKVSESSEFVDETKQLLLQMESMPSVLMHDNLQKSTITNVQHMAVGSLQSEACPENIAHTELLRDSIWSSEYFSQGSLNTFGYNCSGRSSTNPHAVAMPIISDTIGAIKGFCNSKKLPYHMTSQLHAASSQAQVEAITRTEPDADLSSNTVSGYLNTMTIGRFSNIPVMEERLSTGMGVKGFPCFQSTNGELLPSLNELHQLCGGSSSSNNAYGSWKTMTGTRSSELSKPSIHGEEKLLGLQNSSTSTSAMGDLSDVQSLRDISAFVSEIPYSLNFHEASVPQQSLLLSSEYSPSNFVINQRDQLPENGITDLASQMNETLGVSSVSTGFVKSDGSGCIMTTGSSSKPLEKLTASAAYSLGKGSNENVLTNPNQILADNDLFDATVLDMSIETLMQEWWDDTVMPVGNVSCSNLSGSASCISQYENGSISAVGKELLPKSSFEQLLNAIVGDNNKASGCGPITTNINHISGLDKEHQLSTITTMAHPSVHNQVPLLSFPSISHSSDKVMYGSLREGPSSSHVSPWIEDSCSMNTNAVKVNQPKKPEEAVKVVKKRARPGESTRPRPRDRQQIQDRVKELREIVPDGAKCSIDALLDRTIKHMLFLQSVTKYADKIKQTNEPKMIGEESGVVLKENSGGGRGGGTTWAYEVSGQTMVCPIIIEDLTPPGQMLVEMLCEERGFFLEIADVIRGFGLIILKGMMEIRESKIWARFLVEANRDVTRMDIFLSLVQLLQQTSSVRSSDLLAKVIDKGAATLKNYQQSQISIPVGLADRLQ